MTAYVFNLSEEQVPVTDFVTPPAGYHVFSPFTHNVDLNNPRDLAREMRQDLDEIPLLGVDDTFWIVLDPTPMRIGLAFMVIYAMRERGRDCLLWVVYGGRGHNVNLAYFMSEGYDYAMSFRYKEISEKQVTG